MSADKIMTIHVSAEVEAKLLRLAERTSRSKEHLATEAVSAFVEQEQRTIDNIEKGLRDVATGHVVDHDAAMAELHDVIDAAEARRS
ncbi:MAG: CopG family transcriptional regulator [Rhizobium sp.]|nr:MAG: CopG family transcriptional regulator [Rhizobium sp.]